MTRVTPTQKIISFAENKSDVDKITQFIMDDWAIVKLIPYGNYFIGVMEKMQHDHTINDQDRTVYIPPRKDHFYLNFSHVSIHEKKVIVNSDE